MNERRTLLTAALIGLMFAAILTACAGGGTAVAPGARNAGASSPGGSSQGTAQVALSVVLDGASHPGTSRGRSALYVDPVTTQLCVNVDDTPGDGTGLTTTCYNISTASTVPSTESSPWPSGDVCQYASGSSGARTCTLMFLAPSGTVHFAIVANDTSTQRTLAIGVPQPDPVIASGTLNTVSATMMPVLSPNLKTLALATPSTPATPLSLTTTAPCPSAGSTGNAACGSDSTIVTFDSGTGVTSATVAPSPLFVGKLSLNAYDTDGNAIPLTRADGSNNVDGFTSYFASPFPSPNTTTTPTWLVSGPANAATLYLTGQSGGSHGFLYASSSCNTSNPVPVPTYTPTIASPLLYPPILGGSDAYDLLSPAGANYWESTTAPEYPANLPGGTLPVAVGGNVYLCDDRLESAPAVGVSSNAYVTQFTAHNGLGSYLNQLWITPLFISTSGSGSTYTVQFAENGQAGNTATATLRSSCTLLGSLTGASTISTGGQSTTATANQYAQTTFTLSLPVAAACDVAFSFSGQTVTANRTFANLLGIFTVTIP